MDNYTKESAFVSFDENKKGRLMPGYLADLVILDRNIFEVPSMEIKDVRPVATMIGGDDRIPRLREIRASEMLSPG